MILKRGLALSVNSIAAQLVERTGPAAVIDVARRCGIRSALAPVHSVALGTSGVSPLEMAAAFATFAAGGIYHEPFFIRRVEDHQGRILEERLLTGRRALDAAITFQVVDMMRAVLDEGTGSVIRQMGFSLPAAGKTGTTDEFNDAWFTGFTPTLSVSVWAGFDRAVSMRDTHGRGVTGARGAAPIWADFMRKATAGGPHRELPVAGNIRVALVHPVTGQAPLPWAPRGMEVALREGQSKPFGVPAGGREELPEGDRSAKGAAGGAPERRPEAN
jgi:penicillin-binding protein 1A